jgi:hypothetical protein
MTAAEVGAAQKRGAEALEGGKVGAAAAQKMRSRSIRRRKSWSRSS